MYRSITAILLTGFLCANLMAQPGSKHPELRKEMHAYMEANVLPVMQAQRNKLNASLSAQEQAELASIRSEMKTLRETTRALAPKRGERGESSEKWEGPTEEQRAQMHASREQMHQLMERARPIFDAHEATIKGLLEEVSTERQQWHEDLRAMKEAQVGERPEGRPHHGPDGMDRPSDQAGTPPREGPMDKRHGPMGPGRGKPGMGPMHHPMGFLLWDGLAPAEPATDESFDLSIFPNPAATASNLRYEVKTAGSVTIQLLDDQGNVVKTLTKESQVPGTYTESIQVEGLRKGVYIYRVTTQTGTETGKLIIE